MHPSIALVDVQRGEACGKSENLSTSESERNERTIERRGDILGRSTEKERGIDIKVDQAKVYVRGLKIGLNGLGWGSSVGARNISRRGFLDGRGDVGGWRSGGAEGRGGESGHRFEVRKSSVGATREGGGSAVNFWEGRGGTVEVRAGDRTAETRTREGTVEARARRGTVETGGGAVGTGEGTIKTGRRSAETGEGAVETGGGAVETGGRSVETREGAVKTGGGPIKTGGGPIEAGGGAAETGEGTVLAGEGGDITATWGGGNNFRGYVSLLGWEGGDSDLPLGYGLRVSELSKARLRERRTNGERRRGRQRRGTGQRSRGP